MRVEKLPNGRWGICEDDGTVLQTWKTERCALFDLQCYLKIARDGAPGGHPLPTAQS